MSQRIIRLDLERVSHEWTRLRPSSGFRVLHIDPPWLYANFSESGEEKNAINHYPCMPIEDIAKLPLALLMAKDCAVFCWFTWPLMPQWTTVISAWGLIYSSVAWEWIKYNAQTGKFAFGPGYGTRKNLEPCLLLTRGTPRLRKPVDFFGHVTETNSRSMRDFIEWWPGGTIRQPRREHSRKPDEARTRIETMFDGPYCELFARSRAPNWASWGNEIDRFEANGD